MQKFILTLIVLGTSLTSCHDVPEASYEIAGSQSKIIASMIDVVNEKDAEKYVVGFADSVQVFVGSEMKVNGRDAMKTNRANHFNKHPQVRSEIQHLVEIDNRVILHDKVWLDDSDKKGQDIVEIFTFKQGEVARVDVIQPNELFNR